MNNINRVIVKQQAKQLIKEKVFILFVISAIAMFLTVGISTSFDSSNISDVKQSVSEIFGKEDKNENENNIEGFNYGDLEDFFGNSSSFGEESDNPIESFGKSFSNEFGNAQNNSSSNKIVTVNPKLAVKTDIISLIGIILSPLLVTLFGFYVAFVRRNPQEELKLGEEIRHLFKVSFNGTYLKKLVAYILRTVLEAVLFVLLIIPGCIFHYSSYFTFQIMCEFPNLKPSEAIKLSKKMVKGNRSELFVLDLSFILWYLLAAVTCGIALVYVVPYVMTTQALYYENFRIRALQEGRINETDFLSADEIAAKYAQNNAQYATQSDGSQYYYNPYAAQSQPETEQSSQHYYSYEPQQQDNQGSFNPNPEAYTAPEPEVYNVPQPEAEPDVQTQSASQPEGNSELF